MMIEEKIVRNWDWKKALEICQILVANNNNWFDFTSHFLHENTMNNNQNQNQDVMLEC